MKALFSSRRRRRRAIWLAGVILVAGGAAFLGVHFSNTGTSVEAPFTEEPVQLPAKSPKADPFTASERRQVQAVAARFISTAVLRRHVDDSWPLTAPELRQGLSRAEWARGEIPIVPYPAEALAVVRWRLSYSYARRIGLKVAFFPRPGAMIRMQVFEIELKDVGSSGRPHWLVSHWSPSGGAELAPQPGPSGDLTLAPHGRSIRPLWLIVPVALIVGSLLLLVVGLGARGWAREVRARRAYGSGKR